MRSAVLFLAIVQYIIRFEFARMFDREKETNCCDEEIFHSSDVEPIPLPLHAHPAANSREKFHLSTNSLGALKKQAAAAVGRTRQTSNNLWCRRRNVYASERGANKYISSLFYDRNHRSIVFCSSQQKKMCVMEVFPLLLYNTFFSVFVESL